MHKGSQLGFMKALCLIPGNSKLNRMVNHAHTVAKQHNLTKVTRYVCIMLKISKLNLRHDFSTKNTTTYPFGYRK